MELYTPITHWIQDDYEEVQICSMCGGYVGHIGYDDELWNKCEQCDIIEGDTEYIYENKDTGDQITEEEFDKLPLK